MTSDTIERRALALFEQALDHPEDDRPRWLELNSADDAEVRRRVIAMLAADRMASLHTGGATAVDREEDEPVPETIGAYRITGLIARGGMGAVYRGERMAGDFDRTVAIKRIRPGLFSAALVERFQRERQLLATLEHPHIARLYDGGAMTDGAPYLVMEYVDGEPILTYAASRGLDRAQRLALVEDICAAVAYAHRNLVIHRDITPANVLVTAGGAAKLIDFGIARPAMEDADDPAAAAVSGLSETPGYAAPERSRETAATTLGDIYSLGRLLGALVPEPRGAELDAIVTRASAVRPEDRYPTVDALAADLAALRGGRAVAAMGRSRRYLWRTFYQRNRVPIAAAGAALTLLIAAFAGTLWSLDRANASRRAEEARFEQVRSLAHYLLFDLNDQLGRIAGNTGSRADMADRAERYLQVLTRAAGANRPDLRLESAQGLIRLARIQGGPSEPNLGEPARAERNLATAQGLLADLDPTLPAVGAASATAHAVRSQILLNDEMRQDQAGTVVNAAVAALERVPEGARDWEWLAARRAVRRAQIDFADLGSDPGATRALADRLERDIADWPETRRGGRMAAFDRAFAMYLRGQSIAETASAPDLGLPQFREAERRFDRLIEADPDDPVTLLAMTLVLKDAFASASRQEAESTAQRLILKADAISEQLIALDDRDLGVRKRAGSIKEAIAQNHRDHDRFAQAVALQRRVLALRRANIGDDRNARAVADLGFSQMIMGLIARDAGQRALACASWTQAAATMGELERRGRLAGFMQAFVPGLREKRRLCAAGVELDGLQAPIR